MPIVYDPTISPAIKKYSELFINTQNMAYISIDHQENIKSQLLAAASGRPIKLIVVTDGEAILGIGDWGLNGGNISVGKLMVYTGAAGVDPTEVLPVVLDVGTNNETLLKDDLYLGLHQKRTTGEAYYEFVDKFVAAAEDAFPELYLHFEDFGRANADNILDKYKNHYPVFNDDIQGTGIVILAAILGGLNITKERLQDQIYVQFGAGTAGAGITSRVFKEMVQAGLSEEEARRHFYLVDKQGLLFADDKTLTPQQKLFARSREEFADPDSLTDLLSVVKAVHPTILVGTSTVHGAFTADVVKEMAAHTKRPMIFPISNPTELAEATPKDLLTWTDGQALVATGVPFADVNYQGVDYAIGQANNALVYPGLGLGVMASTAKVLNDEMISAAAHSLGGIVDPTAPGAAVLPPVSKLTAFSATVAKAVAKSAVDQGLNKEAIADIDAAIAEAKWEPKY